MSELDSIKPGTPLTDKQKQKLAEENAKESAEAERLAAEHRKSDGAQNPALVDLAGSVKDKLQAKEFLQRDQDGNPVYVKPEEA